MGVDLSPAKEPNTPSFSSRASREGETVDEVEAGRAAIRTSNRASQEGDSPSWLARLGARIVVLRASAPTAVATSRLAWLEEGGVWGSFSGVISALGVAAARAEARRIS